MLDNFLKIPIPVWSVVWLLCFVTVPAFAAADRELVYGKRLWRIAVDDNTRLVVDEMGYVTEDPEVLWMPFYVWRLLHEDETEREARLHSRVGFRGGFGTPPVPDPITVLEARMLGNQMVTVFNQDGRSWAHIAQIQEDGTIQVRPRNAAGPALKSGTIELSPERTPVLAGIDEQDRPVRMELKSRRHHGRDVYYWE